MEGKHAQGSSGRSGGIVVSLAVFSAVALVVTVDVIILLYLDARHFRLLGIDLEWLETHEQLLFMPVLLLLGSGLVACLSTWLRCLKGAHARSTLAPPWHRRAGLWLPSACALALACAFALTFRQSESDMMLAMGGLLGALGVLAMVTTFCDPLLRAQWRLLGACFVLVLSCAALLGYAGYHWENGLSAERAALCGLDVILAGFFFASPFLLTRTVCLLRSLSERANAQPRFPV